MNFYHHFIYFASESALRSRRVHPLKRHPVHLAKGSYRVSQKNDSPASSRN